MYSVASVSHPVTAGPTGSTSLPWAWALPANSIPFSTQSSLLYAVLPTGSPRQQPRPRRSPFPISPWLDYPRTLTAHLLSYEFPCPWTDLCVQLVSGPQPNPSTRWAIRKKPAYSYRFKSKSSKDSAKIKTHVDGTSFPHQTCLVIQSQPHTLGGKNGYFFSLGDT